MQEIHVTPSTSRDRLAALSLAISAGILAFYLATLVVAAILMTFGFSLNRAVAPIGFSCGLGTIFGLSWSAQKRDWLRTAELATLICIGIAIISGALALLVYDMTYDGQAYHQETILQLADGWNPLREELGPDRIPSDEIRPLTNGLTRGPEIVEASIYMWRHRIEMPKMLNLLVLAASLFATLAALLSFDRIGRNWAILIALAAALNPVCIYQAFCYYVDGQLASLLLCLMSFLILYVHTHQRRFATLAMISIAILVNIKFTAIAFAGVYVGAAGLWLIFQRRFRPAFDGALAGAAGLALGLFVGASPYLTNILRHGHPFYPLAGPDSIGHDWNKDRPVNFNAMNRFERLLRANASLPEDGFEGTHFTASQWAPPMWIGAFWRLGHYAYPDVRVAGFGPFFSTAVLLALAAAASTCFAAPAGLRAAFTAIATVLLSALIHPEAWWARYCPQIYLIPVLLLIAPAASNRPAPRYIAVWCMLVFLLNAAIVGGSYVTEQIRWNRSLKRQLAELQQQNRPVLVDFGSSRGNRARLREWGIRFTEVPGSSLPREKTEKLAGSQTTYYTTAADQRR